MELFLDSKSFNFSREENPLVSFFSRIELHVQYSLNVNGPLNNILPGR